MKERSTRKRSDKKQRTIKHERDHIPHNLPVAQSTRTKRGCSHYATLAPLATTTTKTKKTTRANTHTHAHTRTR